MVMEPFDFNRPAFWQKVQAKNMHSFMPSFVHNCSGLRRASLRRLIAGKDMIVILLCFVYYELQCSEINNHTSWHLEGLLPIPEVAVWLVALSFLLWAFRR